MSRPRLLDLFCGAGGSAMGYHRAGFDVVGVDIKPQPHFPFEFIQADWEEPLAYLPRLWEREGIPYAIHASPPCQRYSTMTAKWGRQEQHPDLVAPVREALQEIEVPFVIENVEGAPLLNPVMLCGSMFNLAAELHYSCDCGYQFPVELGKYGCPNCLGERQSKLCYKYQLRRHRLFETSWGILFPPATCCHQGAALPVYGHAGGSSKRDGLKFTGVSAWREGMGIDWMTQGELAESIPPAYTEYIGKYLLQAVQDGK
jgi:DNA (cytosine-5)-methyltransferase 1